jgi:hypothetical protein
LALQLIRFFASRQGQSEKTARCGLALGAKITASPGHNPATDDCAAAVALFSFAAIGPMVPLIFSRLARSVKKIGNGRAAHGDGFRQDFLEHAAKSYRLLLGDFVTGASGMDFCAPQGFVGIDIAYAAKNALIEKQSLDARVPRTDTVGEIFFADFQGIGPRPEQLLGEHSFGEISHAAKPAGIRITEFAAIIEKKKYVCVFFRRLRRRGWADLAGHSEMD